MSDGDVTLKVGLNTETALKDAQKLGREVQTTLNNMDMGKLDSKTLTFIKNLTSATNKMRRLAEETEKFGKSQIPTHEFTELSKRIKKNQEEFDKLLIKQDEMQEKGITRGKDWDALDVKMEQLGSLIREDEKELQQLVDTGKAFTLGANTDTYKDMTEKLNTANQATNILLQRYSEMTGVEREATRGAEEHAEQEGEVADKTDEATEATKRQASASRNYSSVLHQLGTSITRALRNIVRLGGAFRNLARHLFDSNRHHRNLGRSIGLSFKNVLKYTLGIQSLFALVKRGTNTAKEAIKVMAQEIPEVNNAVSMLGTSFKQLKASLGTVFQPLLQAITPILNGLIQKVTSLMNGIARFFATLTGQNYVYEATVANYDYAESVKEAEEANKGALASFDKLNVVAKDNSQNTMALTKDTVTYKKVEINPNDKWYTKLAEKIKKGWEKADLTDVGKDIATTLAAMLDSVSWDDIKAKSTKFTHTLATGINGLTLPDEETGHSKLAESIGNFIGNAIDFAVSNLHEFVTTVDWEQIGDFIATSINTLKDNLNNNDTWRKAGDAFGALFQGLVKMGFQLLVEDNVLEGLGDSISDMLDAFFKRGFEVNPKTGETYFHDLGLTLATGFLNLLTELETIIDREGPKLVEAVNDIAQGGSSKLGEILLTLGRVIVKGILLGIQLAISGAAGLLGIDISSSSAKFFAEALGIGILVSKVGGLIGKITGTGGLLSAFKKKDNALGTQTKKTALDALASVALAGAIGLAGAGAVEAAKQLGGLGETELGVITNTETLTEKFEDTEGALDRIRTKSTETSDAFKLAFESGFKVGGVDTSNFDIFEQYAMSVLNRVKKAYESFNPTPEPKGDGVTNVHSGAADDTKGKAGEYADAYEQYKNNTVTVSNTTATDANTDALDRQYEQQQAAIKATQEATNSIVDLETYFGDNMKILYQLYNEMNPTKTGSAIKLGDKDYQQWKEMVVTEYGKLSATEANQFVQGLSSLLDNYYAPKGTWDGIEQYLGSAEKGLKNLFSWLPTALSALFGGVGLPSIPFGAKGMVLPPNQPFLAMVGDQTNGTNVETPLATIEQAVANVLGKMGIKVDCYFKTDSKTLFKMVKQEATVYSMQYQKPAF